MPATRRGQRKINASRLMARAQTNKFHCAETPLAEVEPSGGMT